MLTPFVAKLIALLVVTFGSLIFGFLPALTNLGRRYQDSVALSAILCFGGGVLFATSVIHILPDVRDDMPKWSELIFCLGFLFIYLVDSFITYFNGKNAHQSTLTESLIPNDSGRHYGTVDIGNEPSVSFNEIQSRNNFEPQRTYLMNIGLLIAFTVHGLLEGLVIGIQETEHDVFLLLGAVCSHKLLVAFCLGAELVADGRPLICPMSIFIFGSDLGIILGMIFQVDNLTSMHTAVPLIEGLAGGTLLYIALSEILPREKGRKLPGYASIWQFLALSIGFSLMSALTLLT